MCHKTKNSTISTSHESVVSGILSFSKAGNDGDNGGGQRCLYFDAEPRLALGRSCRLWPPGASQAEIPGTMVQHLR